MTDHLKMHSLNKIDENIAKIAQLFPNCVTEAKDENGEITHKIDFDMLKQELSHSLVEGREERYQFTWPDKKQAILTANAPINKTLRPCREESVNFDETENLYIEGDNLEVLKLLQETYLGKIKMIYIDPPYNTGNDFVYNDDFRTKNLEFREKSGNFDEEGKQLVDNYTRNTESNGRFHTDWLNMIYPRLKLARDLLSDDGVIFISIDDNEQENLKKCCDEIFGECNFIAQVIWERAYAPINLKKHFSNSHDYIIAYAKNIDLLVCNGLPRSTDQNNDYKNIDNDPRGPWKAGNPSVGPAVEKNIYEITSPTGKVFLPPSGRSWLYSKERFQEMIKDNRIYWGKDGNSCWAPKMFLSEVKQGVTPMTIWKYTEVGHSQDATKALKALFDGHDYFDYPKSIDLIKRCCQLYSQKESIILDFFSGSATTAHAVMLLNSEDEGNRKYIMVQLPEPTNEKTEAYKAGYKNICEIGKERIRRAGKQLLKTTIQTGGGMENSLFENSLTTSAETPLGVSNPCDNIGGVAGVSPAEGVAENAQAVGARGRLPPSGNYKLDLGFRVLKCDTSNMEDVYYTPDHFDKNDLFKSNIKSDRTPEDLLFQVMLDLGIMLSSKIETKQIDGKTVYYVEGNYLAACFDEDVTEETITKIAKEKPYYFVMKDSSMANDSVATNFEQIFTTYSPETVRKIL